MRSWLRGSLVEPRATSLLCNGWLQLRYAGNYRVGNYLSDSGLAKDVHRVFGRVRDFGTDFSSTDDLEPKSYENTRFV